MARINNIQEVFDIFKKKKVSTLDELLKFFKGSIATLRRRLKKWKTYTSFNQNGRYYTLPDTPKFDDYGLWRYRGVYFSKHGNLKKTLTYLVDTSKAGLSGSEMCVLLSLSENSFLSYFKNHLELRREKLIGKFIYFSMQPEIFKRQKREREQALKGSARMDLPTDTDSITILVELVKHPKDKVGRLTRRVRRKGLEITQGKVHNLLLFHGLLKKNLV